VWNQAVPFRCPQTAAQGEVGRGRYRSLVQPDAAPSRSHIPTATAKTISVARCWAMVRSNRIPASAGNSSSPRQYRAATEIRGAIAKTWAASARARGRPRSCWHRRLNAGRSLPKRLEMHSVGMAWGPRKKVAPPGISFSEIHCPAGSIRLCPQQVVDDEEVKIGVKPFRPVTSGLDLHQVRIDPVILIPDGDGVIPVRPVIGTLGPGADLNRLQGRELLKIHPVDQVRHNLFKEVDGCNQAIAIGRLASSGKVVMVYPCRKPRRVVIQVLPGVGPVAGSFTAHVVPRWM